MKASILLLVSFLLAAISYAQPNKQHIENFIIKENLTSNGKIAIIAVDSLENANEKINGVYKFNINAFEQTLNFHQGVAVPADPIASSTFVYFKHKNQESSTGKLYFLYKSDKGITPIKINGLLLLIIPAIILFVAYAAKRFLSTFIVLAFVYGYFSFSKGLSLFKILESAIDIIKNFF